VAYKKISLLHSFFVACLVAAVIPAFVACLVAIVIPDAFSQDVRTYHNNNQRTGLDDAETTLN
jgi:hypothetical protein